MQGIYKGGGWEWFFGGTPGLLPEVEILMGEKHPQTSPLVQQESLKSVLGWALVRPSESSNSP